MGRGFAGFKTLRILRVRMPPAAVFAEQKKLGTHEFGTGVVAFAGCDEALGATRLCRADAVVMGEQRPQWGAKRGAE